MIQEWKELSLAQNPIDFTQNRQLHQRRYSGMCCLGLKSKTLKEKNHSEELLIQKELSGVLPVKEKKLKCGRVLETHQKDLLDRNPSCLTTCFHIQSHLQESNNALWCDKLQITGKKQNLILLKTFRLKNKSVKFKFKPEFPSTRRFHVP